MNAAAVVVIVIPYNDIHFSPFSTNRNFQFSFHFFAIQTITKVCGKTIFPVSVRRLFYGEGKEGT